MQRVMENMLDNCSECEEACNPTTCLHYSTQNWWPCDNSQAKQPSDVRPAPVLYDDKQLKYPIDELQFKPTLECEYPCASCGQKKKICQTCWPNEQTRGLQLRQLCMQLRSYIGRDTVGGDKPGFHHAASVPR